MMRSACLTTMQDCRFPVSSNVFLQRLAKKEKKHTHKKKKGEEAEAAAEGCAEEAEGEEEAAEAYA